MLCAFATNFCALGGDRSPLERPKGDFLKSAKNEKVDRCSIGHTHATMNVKPHHFTKFCKFAFVGCSNLSCNYAHSATECRSSIDYATKDVPFLEPTEMLDAFLPRFIVKFNDDDDDQDEVMPSISLSQIDAIQKSDEYHQVRSLYLPQRMNQLASQRIFDMVREYSKAVMTHGEAEMDLEEDMDLSE
jgi:hypothetical protein